jgi:hypothetical protein
VRSRAPPTLASYPPSHSLQNSPVCTRRGLGRSARPPGGVESLSIRASTAPWGKAQPAPRRPYPDGTGPIRQLRERGTAAHHPGRPRVRAPVLWACHPMHGNPHVHGERALRPAGREQRCGALRRPPAKWTEARRHDGHRDARRDVGGSSTALLLGRGPHGLVEVHGTFVRLRALCASVLQLIRQIAPSSRVRDWVRVNCSDGPQTDPRRFGDRHLLPIRT